MLWVKKKTAVRPARGRFHATEIFVVVRALSGVNGGKGALIGWGMARRRVAIVLAIALAGTTFGAPILATEPDGRIAIRYEWIRSVEDGESPPQLRLSITPYVPITDASLVVRAPASVGVRLASIAGAVSPADPSRDGSPIPLGDVGSGRPLVLEFRIDRPNGASGGIVAFTVDAKDAFGRVLREGAGVPVGPIGPPATVRDGALEYPASRPGDPRP